MYKVWKVYDGFATHYVVVNRLKHVVQSSWNSWIDAVKVAKDLNILCG